MINLPAAKEGFRDVQRFLLWVRAEMERTRQGARVPSGFTFTRKEFDSDQDRLACAPDRLLVYENGVWLAGFVEYWRDGFRATYLRRDVHRNILESIDLGWCGTASEASASLLFLCEAVRNANDA